MTLQQRLVLVLLHGLRDQDLEHTTLPALDAKGRNGLVIRRLLLESCDRPESEILTGRRPTEAGHAFDLRRRARGDRDVMRAARLALWRPLHRFLSGRGPELDALLGRLRPEETLGIHPALLRHFRRSQWPPAVRTKDVISSGPLWLAESVVAAGGTVELSGLAVHGTDDLRVAHLLSGGRLPETTFTVTSLRDAALEADRHGIDSPEFRAAVGRTEAHLSRIIRAHEAGDRRTGLVVAAVRSRMRIATRLDAAALIRERAVKAHLHEGADYLLLMEPRFARVWDLRGKGLEALASVFQVPPLSEHGRIHRRQNPLPGMAEVGTSYGDLIYAAAPGVVLEPNDRARVGLRAIQASALRPDQPAGFALHWSGLLSPGSFFDDVRGADLAATIAACLGVELPPRSPGRSLLPHARRTPNQGVPPPSSWNLQESNRP